jgi:phytoene dehydrogenase-like protein
VRALFAGIAAHAMVPLDAPATASFALVLAVAAHAVGWPIVRGGSRAIADALTACLLEAGGDLEVGRFVERLDELPRARAYVLDVTPRQLLRIAGEALHPGYRRRLERFRYGPGVYKVDFALRGPIPWRNATIARAATVHLSGNHEEVVRAEAAAHGASAAERPFVLLVQPTLYDATRAPPGLHTAWAYCHVPHGSVADLGAAIEEHIEHFAPGFRDLVLERCTRTAVELERYNPNYVGGDINGGLSDLRQLLTRPVARLDPYATSVPNIFLCSSSTPPGGAVHGMCGYFAARSVLGRVFGIRGDKDQPAMPEAAATSSR